MSKVKYDGWCMKNTWDGVMPWSFQQTRAEVIKWWHGNWDIKRYPRYSWRNTRRRGTHSLVKVRIVEVENG